MTKIFIMLKHDKVAFNFSCVIDTFDITLSVKGSGLKEEILKKDLPWKEVTFCALKGKQKLLFFILLSTKPEKTSFSFNGTRLTFNDKC